MPRQRCCGLVDEKPLCRKFFPQGEKAGEAPVIVQVEELEALCLKDIKGFEQATCASIMGLSGPTFQIILESGRSKVAMALVEGRTIIIEGAIVDK